MTDETLEKLCKLIRYDILTSTTQAGSGHPTSCLSAVELMTTLFFGGFYHSDDRVILSKGHAAPLLYSLYHAAGLLSYEELMKLRTFGSPLEGHPTPRFPYVDVATGSLGQGLSVGIGMAIGIRSKMKQASNVFVLLGDSEMAEGQVWEAMEIAAYYKLANLVAILDVNRLGQQSPTMERWHIETYAKRAEAFGWRPILIDDGHNLRKVQKAFDLACSDLPNPTEAVEKAKPTIIIAKTIKGKGVSFLENKDGWHGKTLDKNQLKMALKELGTVDLSVRGKMKAPRKYQDLKLLEIRQRLRKILAIDSKDISSTYREKTYATREAFGDALANLGYTIPNVVVFDAETANSTYENKFQKNFPQRFFEMFIAEENMMSVALGISKVGFIPFVSTFAAFLTQTFDQIRMAQYSQANLKIVGSHAGVSIGADGPSQMGLEDIAMMRSILNSFVFYPSDAVSAAKLTDVMAQTDGISYLRTTREKTPIIYPPDEEFPIGQSKIHRLKASTKTHRKILIISAGITLHEALKAQRQLQKEGVEIIVMDCYSIKPIDEKSINHYANETGNVVVVEDHYPAGGLGEAVLSALKEQKTKVKFIHLCVRKLPRSGSREELLRYEEIDASAIVSAVSSITQSARE